MKDYKNFPFFCLTDVIRCIYKCYILILKSDNNSLRTVGSSRPTLWVIGSFCTTSTRHSLFFVVSTNTRSSFRRKTLLPMSTEISFLLTRIWPADVTIKHSSKIHTSKSILCRLEYSCFAESFIWRMMSYTKHRHSMSVVNPLILPSKFSLLEIRKNPKQACKKRKGD